MKDKDVLEQEVAVGSISKNSKYSTHFNSYFNVDGTPNDHDLELVFRSPQNNIDMTVSYAKYCYRKYGIIMRVVNIIRDFGATGVKLEYPNKRVRAKKVIDEYNKRINIDQLLRDFLYELALTGNLVCYDRDGRNVDIYPINQVDVMNLIVDSKQMLAFKVQNLFNNFGFDYDKETMAKIGNAYPDEIKAAMKDGKALAVLNPENAYFAKINSSRYEPYGLPVILPAFEDLAHKSLLKEAEKATLNDIIDKIMLIQVGDKDNKPTREVISKYTELLDGISGSVRLTVPYFVDAKFVEPETSIFSNEKYLEVDTDILNTLGISLSLIRGESGGNYAEGIINFSGLVRTIETIRNPLVSIIEGLYRQELRRNGISEDDAPRVSFNDVIIDKEQKLGLVKSLFTEAGLPYEILYNEFGFDFDAVKVIREQENEANMEEVFRLHSNPFSANAVDGGGDNNQVVDKGGAPKKPLTERKTDPTASNNSQPRTGIKNANRSK